LILATMRADRHDFDHNMRTAHHTDVRVRPGRDRAGHALAMFKTGIFFDYDMVRLSARHARRSDVTRFFNPSSRSKEALLSARRRFVAIATVYAYQQSERAIYLPHIDASAKHTFQI